MKTSASAPSTPPLSPIESDSPHIEGEANLSAAPATHADKASAAFPDLKPRKSTDTSASTPRARQASISSLGETIEMGRLGRTNSIAASHTSNVSQASDVRPPSELSQASEAQASEGSQATEEADDEITFKMPESFSGSLTREGGRLHCAQDHGVQSVLDLISELDPAAVRDLQIPPGSRISIEWDENLMDKMSAFMGLAGGNPLVATDLLRDAIGKGDGAFTASARMPGTDTHPSEFLRNIDIRVRVTPNAQLGEHLQSILARQSPDSANSERIDKFRNDFGAMSLLALATNKDFNKQLAYGLGASLIGTGSIGATFDYGIWANVKKSMSPSGVTKYGPLLDSLTPLIAETFDSMVIKRLLEVMKGGNFLPSNFGEAMGDLKGAAFSGTIAAIGSIANNYVRDLAKAARDAGHPQAAIALLVAKQLTNLLATWTSGAMVPLEVMGDHEELVKAKMGLISAGVVPAPDVADVHKYVSDSALNTVRAARGTGSAVRSMATGGEIAATIGLVLSLLEHSGIISTDLEQLITLMYATPTEVISMTSSMASEKWVGADGGKEGARITTDAGKRSEMLGRIARSGDTTLEDLDQTARPAGERNASFGYAVTRGLGEVMGLVDQGADMGKHYAGAALSNIEKIPYVAPVLTTTGQGIAGGAQFVFDHALKPAGKGVHFVSSAAYQHAIKPVGRGIAWTAEKASPVLVPVGQGAMAVAAVTGKHVVKPIANATAVTVDTAVRVPGATLGAGAKALGWVASAGSQALGNAIKARRRREQPEDEATGPDMV